MYNDDKVINEGAAPKLVYKSGEEVQAAADSKDDSAESA